MYFFSVFNSLIFTYSIVGLTQRAKLLGNVHGVVVHATNSVVLSSAKGKLTVAVDNSYKTRFWEIISTSWIIDIFVVFFRLEITQRSRAGRREWHNFDTSVYHALFEDLVENEPHGLHEGRVHGFIVVVEINPSADTIDDFSPFRAVFHDDRATLVIVCGDSHFVDVGGTSYFQFLVDFVLHWNTVTIPTESSLDMVVGLVGEPCDDVFKTAS